jgi:hypothetical protein
MVNTVIIVFVNAISDWVFWLSVEIFTSAHPVTRGRPWMMRYNEEHCTLLVRRCSPEVLGSGLKAVYVTGPDNFITRGHQNMKMVVT